MATAEKLRELLDSDELSNLDFKAGSYYIRLGDRSARGPDERGNGYLDLLKDILAMSNTPRTESAYLVLGVKNSIAGNRVCGLPSSALLDDNDIQRLLTGWCDPVPKTILTNHSLAGKPIQVIEIQQAEGVGPFLLKSELSPGQKADLSQYPSFLKSGSVYFRRGTSNTEATPEWEAHIRHWFSRISQNWQTWLVLKDRLEAAARNASLVLFTSPLPIVPTSGVSLGALASFDWVGVFDFDPASSDNGLLSAIREHGISRSLVVATKGATTTVNVDTGVFWYFARGIDGRPDTLVQSQDKPWIRWRNAYSQDIQEQVRRLSSSIAPRKPVVVVLWYESQTIDFLKSLVEHCTVFDEPQFLVISDNVALKTNLNLAEFDIEFFQMPLVDLCGAIQVEFASREAGAVAPHTIPTNSGAPTPVPADKVPWLEAGAEVFYTDLDSAQLKGGDNEALFLTGGTITVDDLKLRRDVERERTSRISHRVVQDLESRETVRINLNHAPGAGGSTVARRIAWDLHGLFPTLLLKDSTAADVREQHERINYIYSKTNRSILLVVDSSTAANRTVDDLFALLKSSNLPVVMLQVGRRLVSTPERERTFKVELTLVSLESAMFLRAYREVVPDRGALLQAVHDSSSASERSAFIYGLTAYGENYSGLDRFVTGRLEGLTPIQKAIMLNLAIAYEYGQRGLPPEAFTHILGTTNRTAVSIESAFRDRTASLDLIVSENGTWRPIHSLVSQSMIETLLRPQGGERDTWRQALSQGAIGFIELCRGRGTVESASLLELATRVCVYRDAQDFLGTDSSGAVQQQFSRLIEDIPSDEGRAAVLKALTDYYPDKSHFFGHLGRFLAYRMHDYPGALNAINTGLSLSPQDHVLLHMKGMAFRFKVGELIEQRLSLDLIAECAVLASAAFAEAREISPDEEYSFISDVQLRIRVLEYVRNVHGSVLDYVRLPGSITYIRQALVESEDLLALLKSRRALDQNPSRLEEQCRANLSRLQGDHARALEVWENLLSRPDLAHSGPRRQLVYTLLDRYGTWKDMPSNAVDRCTRLLIENLEESVTSDADLRLWLQATRFNTQIPSLDAIIEKVTYWRANTNSVEANYYFYVLLVLRILKGTRIDIETAKECIETCKSLSRYKQYRTNSFEWYGLGDGIQGLVHQSLLGAWDASQNFWGSATTLARATGVVSRVDGPGAGVIDVAGLEAFFVPAPRRQEPITTSNMNQRVTFYLGFSYSGLRAWSVELS